MNIKELRKCSFCELFWKEKTRKRISENVEVDLRKVGCLTAHDLRDKGTSKHSLETDTEVLQLVLREGCWKCFFQVLAEDLRLPDRHQVP